MPSLIYPSSLQPSFIGENKPPGSVEGYSPKGKEGAAQRASLSPKDKKLQASKYCWLCAFQFTLFKRQHHCRLCDASCCDDCCKKKGILEGQQVMNMNNNNLTLFLILPLIQPLFFSRVGLQPK